MNLCGKRKRLLRILHVQATIAPNFGGPTTVLAGLAGAQAKEGHHLTVCTTDRDHPQENYLAPNVVSRLFPPNVDVRTFPIILPSVLYSRPMAAWLRKHVRDYDIVHIHGLYRFPMTYAAMQARKQGVPYIVRPCGTLDPYLHAKSTRSQWLKRLYKRLFAVPSLNHASAIHYTAEDERNRVGHLKLRAPSFVMPNGLDWAPYRSLPPRGALRARWGLGDAPIVLFLGRLHFKKGLDLLIQAFDEVRKQVRDGQLVIVGPETDDYGRRVRGWVRERGLQKAVHFVGPLQGPDVVQAYVDADVFALPSYTENFGMTVAEAMACALPVVISDQVNIHADVAEAGAGLVARCAAGEVAAALRNVLLAPEGRRAMGEAGRRFVHAHYAWPVIIDKLTKEYEALVDRANGNIDAREAEIGWGQ
jgi:glycosyltransferase involved in cell wall biosynthesis